MKQAQSRRGLTLLETILALGILTVALLGLLAVFTSGLKMTQVSAEVTAASSVGAEFLELTRARGYGATALGTFDGRILDPADTATGFPFVPYPVIRRDQTDYTLVVTCADVTPTIRSVQVDVYYDVAAGQRVRFHIMTHL